MSAYEELGRKTLEIAIEQGWLDKLLDVFKTKHKILVLGSSGVGKTNLLKSLTTLSPEIIDAVNRTEFAQKAKINVAKQPFIFIDTPGQEHHQSRRLKAVREAISDGVSGVINVVSYGYHEYDGGKDDAINQDGSVNCDYLKEYRELEIELMKEWLPLAGSPEVGKWLITIVTKADLWWEQKKDVIEHYRAGDYFSSLEDAQSMNPIVLHYSSVFHKFYDVGSLSGGFDENDRKTARTNLLGTLLASIGKGELTNGK